METTIAMMTMIIMKTMMTIMTMMTMMTIMTIMTIMTKLYKYTIFGQSWKIYFFGSGLETFMFVGKCMFFGQLMLLSDTGVLGIPRHTRHTRHTRSDKSLLRLLITDVTFADEDNNFIPTADVNRAILGNVAVQVVPPGGQNWN